MVALQHARAPEEPFEASELDAARADVERLAHGLPAVAMAAWPDEVRRASRACALAVAAAERRRALVGERSDLDEDATAAVLDAYRAVDEARTERRAAVAESHLLLALGNAWAALALAAAAVAVQQGIEPMATPVYSAVVAAAAGPATMFAIGLTRRSFATIKVDTARAAWAAALTASGFATMGQLHARRIAVAAWRRRASEADAADAAVDVARADWHRLVGESFSPIEGPLLAFRLASLRTAQLRLLHLLLASRTEAFCHVERGEERNVPHDKTEVGSAGNDKAGRPVSVDEAPSFWLMRLGRRFSGRPG